MQPVVSTNREEPRANYRDRLHCEEVKDMRSPEEVAYHSAKQRCTNPKHPHYARYGGRGIEFRFASFKEFIAVIGLRPSPEHELDRENNDGHYEASNVRWVTGSLSAANRTSSNPNTNGYAGTYLQDGRWVARVRLNKHSCYLGSFDCQIAAARACKTATQSRALLTR